MYMSLADKYVFLGNRKAASTTMGDFLRTRCEICSSTGPNFAPRSVERPQTKHLNYRQWRQTYDALFRKLDVRPGQFFIFGIIRDPLDRLASAFNYRRKAAFGETSTAALDPDRFVERFLDGERPGIIAKTSGQSDFFADDAGKIGVNFLVRLEHADEDFQNVLDETGLDFRRALGARLNESERREFRIQSAELRERLDQWIARDNEMYRRQAGRMLRPVEPSQPINVPKALKVMALRTNQYDVAATLLNHLRAQVRAGKNIDPREIIEAMSGEPIASVRASDETHSD